jgi:dihydrofolate reductase
MASSIGGTLSNIVYIATSMDGFISSEDGSLDWLECVPNPEGSDLGFGDFIADIDALIMGRKTFETIVGFDLGWHYPVPGIVLSTTMQTIPAEFRGSVELAAGAPEDIVALTASKGFRRLYIDGGNTIQRFLQADLIDELIVSQLPILLGGGERLFGRLSSPLNFELVDTQVLLGQIVKQHYRREPSDQKRQQ